MDHIGTHLPHQKGKLVPRVFQMIVKNGIINGVERFLTRKADGKRSEMTLKSRIDRKTPGTRVHACQILTIVNVFWAQFVPIVPK